MQTTIKRSIIRKYHHLVSNSQKLETSILFACSSVGVTTAMYAFMAASHIIKV